MSDSPTTRSRDGGSTEARVFLRPIANPYALGFIALAVATIIMAGTELGWIPGTQRHPAAVLIIAFAPALQLVSCWFGFLARDAVAATSMGILSATWLCVGLSLLLSSPGSHDHALSLLLFTASTAILFSANTAAQTKLVPAFVLALTAARFALTGVFEWGEGSVWGHVAGWTGVALAAAALYAALSLELEDTKHRTVLPTLRHGAGKRVLRANLDEQVQDVAAEAGVRGQL